MQIALFYLVSSGRSTKLICESRGEVLVVQKPRWHKPTPTVWPTIRMYLGSLGCALQAQINIIILSIQP